MALLEVLWCDNPHVQFNELIPEDTYTKEDAATAFGTLLGKCYYIHKIFRCFQK